MLDGATYVTKVSNSYCDGLLPHMLRHGFVPVALIATTGVSAEEINALRDPALHRADSKGPYEGINKFFFLHGANHLASLKPPKRAESSSVAIAKAQSVCERQRAYLANVDHRSNHLKVKEVDAYFVRNDSNLPAPPHWTQGLGRIM